jgi:glucose-1-phosphate thymidylyltransferase
MKGIILAGGTGSRLSPLTNVTNKHLLPVGKKPMILHSIDKLVESGIRDIMIVTGTEHMGDMISLLGSGNKWGCNLTYRVQDKPDGIAGALILCENFCRDSDFVTILGDNIFNSSLRESIVQFKKMEATPKCLLNLCEVKDPSRFGVPTIKDNKIIKVTEKPTLPDSNFCVTGIYIYDRFAFNLIKHLNKSERGEYEITDLNNLYIEKGTVGYRLFDSWWVDAGTHKSYQEANRLSSENRE